MYNPFTASVGEPLSWTEFPRESSECVFMGRAIHVLGNAKFGDAWTGTEMVMEVLDALPDTVQQITGNTADDSVEASWINSPAQLVLQQAHDLLLAFRPDLGRRPWQRGPAGLSHWPPLLRFTVREWKAAQEIIQAARDVQREAVRRYEELVDTFVLLCESGFLETKLRPYSGGRFYNVPPSDWNGENIRDRFRSFKMHPMAPFWSAAPDHEKWWIFITRASFWRVIDIERKHAPKAEDESRADEPTGHRSIYVNHMLRVGNHMQVTPEHQPKKAHLEAKIMELWTDAVPLSGVDVKRMASFIRDPASRAGRNRPKSR
jgi:hypothetical protein